MLLTHKYITHPKFDIYIKVYKYFNKYSVLERGIKKVKNWITQEKMLKSKNYTLVIKRVSTLNRSSGM